MRMAVAEFLIVGAVLGALAVGIARSVRRYETVLLFVFMIAASLAYVIFVFWAGESFFWLLIELTGVALYGAMGLVVCAAHLGGLLQLGRYIHYGTFYFTTSGQEFPLLQSRIQSLALALIWWSLAISPID